MIRGPSSGWITTLWALIAMVGCASDDPPDAMDSGTPADAAPDASRGPQIPWLSAEGAPTLDPLLPCPAGHREVGSELGVGSCDPYPEGGPSSCATGEAHFVGEPSCATVGGACPAGDFPSDVPAGALFVLEGATGGDGSTALPFGTITEALAVATTGSTVVVGRGRYAEVISIPAGVTLRGACASETIVAGSVVDPRIAMINVAGPGVVVRDIGVGTSNHSGIAVRGATAELTLEGVIVEGATFSAIVVLERAHLVARGLLVRETRPDGTGSGGRGLVSQDGSVELERAVFDRNWEAALFLGLPNASLVATDLAVTNTRSGRGSGVFGRGLNVQDGARAELRRSFFAANRDSAIFADGAGTSLTLEDVVVRDTLARDLDDNGGRGLSMQNGVTATVTRTLFDRNGELGIFVGGAPSSLVMNDVVIRDTEGMPTADPEGRALAVVDGGRAEVNRTVFERNREVAVVADGWGSFMSLTDVLIRDTQGQITDERFGRAISGQYGAEVVATRVLMEGNREVAVLAYGADAIVRLSDAIVRETAADVSGNAGIGFGTYEEARLEATRFLVTTSALAGVQLAAQGEMDLHDGEVSNSPIGANVQTEGFDISRLQDGVAFVENGTNLDNSDLPLPVPSAPSSEL